MQTKYLLLTPFKLKVAFNLKYQNFNLLKYIFKKYLICHNFLSSSYKGNRIKSIRINVNVTNAYSSEFHIHIYREREKESRLKPKRNETDNTLYFHPSADY